MSGADRDPSPESLAEIPEVDFSKAIRPNRYANLRGAFRHAVFLDAELWARYGSEEKVIETLRLLADLAERKATATSARRRGGVPPRGSGRHASGHRKRAGAASK